MPTKAVNKSSEVGEGNLQCIALHQDGLFVGGDDGVLRCLDVTSSTVQVVESFLVGAPISSLDWSLFFNVLAIGSSKVRKALKLYQSVYNTSICVSLVIRVQ